MRKVNEFGVQLPKVWINPERYESDLLVLEETGDEGDGDGLEVWVTMPTASGVMLREEDRETVRWNGSEGRVGGASRFEDAEGHREGLECVEIGDVQICSGFMGLISERERRKKIRLTKSTVSMERQMR